ncbi:MAG: IS66 family insertion sequence element accessory protein TnpB [Clostridiaceae bacterium]|nr:IS66 family insertion sequence element accessory protein TnpB [Clostridiaceae bacterium]
MLNLELKQKVYLAKGVTDLRKSITGLSIIVEQEFELNPHNRNLYVFCNRRRNRIKILKYDHNDFTLFIKALDEGKFIWPKEDEEDLLEVTAKELGWLLHGLSLVDRLSEEGKRKLYSI